MSVPFNIACGTCRNCTGGWTSFCLRTNPTEGMDGAAYGYANMGPYDGGQAELLRVPFADFNLLELPPGTEHEHDFTMLSDIFPTGYHGTELAEVGPGDSVAVFGAGPVGLMAAHSAVLRGASRVFVVDQQADRLALAERVRRDPVDFSQGRPRSSRSSTPPTGIGVDRGVECVGWQAHDPSGEEHPELRSTTSSRSSAPPAASASSASTCRRTRASTTPSSAGRIGWDYGTFFTKGQRMGTGQAPVKRYNRQLRDLILTGRATPGLITSHEVGLDEAVDAYERFDRREDGWTKVLLHP